MELSKNSYQCFGTYIKYLFLVCLFMTMVSFPNHVYGNSLWKISTGITILPEEMVLLPKWCQIRMQAHPVMFGHKNAKPVPASVMRQNAQYEKIIGKIPYTVAHHYCRGLNWLNRYNRSKTLNYKGVENDRQNALHRALGDFRFMKNHLTPTHKLYYPVLMNEADICMEQKNYKVAINNYREIIKRKPGYAKSYVKYAEILYSIGETDESIKVLRLGLENTDNSQIIKQALSEMGWDKQ